jgi:hypothetical protein
MIMVFSLRSENRVDFYFSLPHVSNEKVIKLVTMLLFHFHDGKFQESSEYIFLHEVSSETMKDSSY